MNQLESIIKEAAHYFVKGSFSILDDFEKSTNVKLSEQSKTLLVVMLSYGMLLKCIGEK